MDIKNNKVYKRKKKNIIVLNQHLQTGNNMIEYNSETKGNGNNYPEIKVNITYINKEIDLQSINELLTIELNRQVKNGVYSKQKKG